MTEFDKTLQVKNETNASIMENCIFNLHINCILSPQGQWFSFTLHKISSSGMVQLQHTTLRWCEIKSTIIRHCWNKKIHFWSSVDTIWPNQTNKKQYTDTERIFILWWGKPSLSSGLITSTPSKYKHLVLSLENKIIWYCCWIHLNILNYSIVSPTFSIKLNKKPHLSGKIGFFFGTFPVILLRNCSIVLLLSRKFSFYLKIIGKKF